MNRQPPETTMALRPHCGRWLPTAAGLLLAALLAGCAMDRPLKERGRADTGYQELRNSTAAASERFARHTDSQRQLLEQAAPRTALPAPVMPSYDPLDDVRVSLSMDNTDVRHVLTALARETGMNLSLHPDLAATARIISLEFEQVPASQVFREILRIADLHGEVEGNVMRVSPFQEKFYDIDLIETNIQSRFNMGGDVLGSGGSSRGGSGGSQALSGNYQLGGSSADMSNPYVVLETMLGTLMGAGESITVNRLSGTLFVRASPSTIRTVDRLVGRFQDMVHRQILLEARIIEVVLADAYRWGIDWTVVRDLVIGSGNAAVAISSGVAQAAETAGAIARSSNPALSGDGTGVIISHASDADSTLLAMEMLEQFGEVQILSNPTLRARHGQPAMISVGTSNTFINEVEVTASTGTLNDTVSTDIQTDTVFDGLLLGVIPFIGDAGKISLTLNPIKSDVDRESLRLVEIQDTAVALPEVNLKEMSTTVRVNDGDTIILGGLIDSVRSEDRRGLPGTTRGGGLGRLFGSEEMTHEIRELVIVMRVRQL